MIGISSIKRGISPAPMLHPCREDDEAVISQTSSQPKKRLFSNSILAPIACSTSMIPLRVSLMPTSRMVTCASGTIAAATRKKAGGRNIARDAYFLCAQIFRRRQNDTWLSCCWQLSAHKGEHTLGMVAALLRLNYSCIAVGIQPCKQNRRLKLCGRDGQCVGDTV